MGWEKGMKILTSMQIFDTFDSDPTGTMNGFESFESKST
jgi:hypothetical protein